MFQVLALFAIADATMHHRRPQIGKTSVIAKRRLYLCSQLSGRLENETAKFSVMTEECQNRESKCRCFASPGLRGTDQIFPGKNDRKRAELNGRRLGESHCLRPANYFGRESKVVKRHDRRLMPHTKEAKDDKRIILPRCRHNYKLGLWRLSAVAPKNEESLSIPEV
jgi:hypothetical protein